MPSLHEGLVQSALSSCVSALPSAPTWQSKTVEFTVYALFVMAALNAWGQGRRWLFTLLAGSLTGFCAEAFLVSRPEARYVYGVELFYIDFWGVPLCIGLGWGLVFYAATWTAQRLAARSARHKSGFGRSVAASSFVAGALGVNLDLSLDPVANAHRFWMWRTWRDGVCSLNTADTAWTMFGVPYDNFVAWMLGIGIYGGLVRLLFHWVNGKASADDGPGSGTTGLLMPGAAARRGSALAYDLLIPLFAGVVAAGVFVGIRLVAGYVYAAIGSDSSGSGAGEARFFAILFLFGLGFTAAAISRGSRGEEPNAVVLLLVAYFHLISFGLLLTVPYEVLGGLAPLLVIVPLGFAAGLVAYSWPSLDAILERLRSRRKPEEAKLDEGYWVPPIIRKTLASYGGTKVRALVAEPENERELQGLLAYAREGGRKVTFRTAGLAFDSQSLNDQLVISLKRFDKIELNVAAREVVVGCGATWGRILKVTLEAGLAPYTMVTSAVATAGGTLSGHSLSRFSPSVGREGQYVKSFRLLTLNGKIMVCSRSHPNGTDEHALFNAVIGGLGYVGAVLEITYQLMQLPSKEAVVKTTFTLVEGLEKTVSALTPMAGVRFKPLIKPFIERVCESCAQRSPDDPPLAMSAAVNLRGGAWGLIAESRYAEKEPLRPSVFHSPSSFGHTVLQLLAMVPWLRGIGYKLTYRSYSGQPKTYVDLPHGYTFFEDGNRRVRRFLNWLGLPSRLIQQTFMIQCDIHDPSASIQTLTAFLRRADEQFERDKVDPALVDALYVGRDQRDFILSSSRGLDAFAVTFTFERLIRPFRNEVAALRALSKACAELDGRVHLVKHVYADRVTLTGMYGQALLDLRAVRSLHDSAALSNEFSERALPGL